MPPIRVQLAFQGGGAKICGLLAAAHAIKELEASGELAVTRVAGTSAGAIVGALYAAGANFKDIRARVRGVGATAALSALFPQRSRSSMMFRVLNGKPFWNEQRIRKLLDQEFHDLHVHTLGDVRAKAADRQLKIVATDLTNSKSVIYERDDQPIVNAILDSCGIPFYFRVAGKHQIVDGGICENLPVELLDGETSQYGAVLAVGFERRAGEPPHSLGTFAAALLDTAMNHSMLRARSRVTKGHLFEVQPEFGTFDFPSAIRSGFGEFYASEFERAKTHFTNLINGLKAEAPNAATRESGNPWSRVDLDTLHKLGDLWRDVLPKQHVRCDQFEFTVQANSLCPVGHPLHGQPDVMTTRVRMTPLAWPFICHSVAFTSTQAAGGLDVAGETALLERACGVYNADGSPIETTQLPALDRHFPLDRRMLLFFAPPLTADGPHHPPFDVHIRDLGENVLSPLLADGKDNLEVAFDRAEGVVGEVKIVLLVPHGAADVKVQPDEAARKANAVPLSEADRATAPAGFTAHGIKAKNIDASGTFRMDVFRQ